MTTKNNTVLQFALCVFEGFEHDTLHSSVVNDTLASDDKLSLLTVREAYAEQYVSMIKETLAVQLRWFDFSSLTFEKVYEGDKNHGEGFEIHVNMNRDHVQVIYDTVLSDDVMAQAFKKCAIESHSSKDGYVSNVDTDAMKWGDLSTWGTPHLSTLIESVMSKDGVLPQPCYVKDFDVNR